MRKKQKHYLSIIIILILCITIGYAYLSSTLNGEITTVNIYPVTRKCQRAKTLHSITCTSSSTEGYCKARNREDSITFGQIGTSGKLASGDAFDCDVNGDGTYDAATERFYYVSDLNSSTAILIYYTYTNRYPYNAQSSNSYSGPITAVGALPTTTITYGNLGTSGTLSLGDVFDCDVKGTGTTNRFYYLTDLDSTTAILLSSTFSYKHFSTLYNLAGSAPCGARPVIEVLKNDMDY